MSNFHETTAQGFSKRAEAAYVEYMNGGPVELLEKAAWFEKQVARHRALIASDAPASVPAKPVKVRCPHYSQIKEFFSVAREKGLDTTAKDRARGAVGMLLGRRVASRADLSGQEWSFATNALRMGKLTW